MTPEQAASDRVQGQMRSLQYARGHQEHGDCGYVTGGYLWWPGGVQQAIEPGTPEGAYCACGQHLGYVIVIEPDGRMHADELNAPAPEELPGAGADTPEDLQSQSEPEDLEEAREHESELVRTGLDRVRTEVDPITAQIALIDPTQPYGPKEVEEHILDATARLERGISYEAGLIAAAYQAEVEHKLAYASALAESSGSDVKQREAKALLRTENTLRQMVRAQQVRDAMKATTHSLRSVLSAYQSVAKSVTAAYGVTNRREF
jgi:hypothetical protein